MSDLIPKSEFDRYCRIAASGVIHLDLLSEFQQGFVVDIAKKLEQYKRHTYISDKQHAVLDQIEELLKDELGDDY